MKSNIYIPKRINVGFQNRIGTYTGKLAYIIYWDEKNKLRKETSWNNWRDHDIEPQDFDNEPTEGFVLNKKVGDCNSGWNHRYAYCRVYDPRGFEFEITIENLLYILENANCIKGKGLEGEFVYGWDGKDLVLLPVNSPDYKEIQSYTEIISTNNTIKLNDLVVGYTYETKTGEHLTYLGKHPYYKSCFKYKDENGEVVKVKAIKDIPNDIIDSEMFESDFGYYMGEYLWFTDPNINGKMIRNRYHRFEKYKNIPRKFIKVVEANVHRNFDALIDIMQGQSDYSPVDVNASKIFKYNIEQFESIIKSRTFIVANYRGILSSSGYSYLIEKEDNDTFSVRVSRGHQKSLANYREPQVYSLCGISKEDKQINMRLLANDFYERFKSFIKTDEKEMKYRLGRVIKADNIEYKHATGLTLQQLYERLEPCYIVDYLENGRAYRAHEDHLKLSGLD